MMIFPMMVAHLTTPTPLLITEAFVMVLVSVGFGVIGVIGVWDCLGDYSEAVGHEQLVKVSIYQV